MRFCVWNDVLHICKIFFSDGQRIVSVDGINSASADAYNYIIIKFYKSS